MTLAFFSHTKRESTNKERYYISQFDGDTYRIVESVEKREFCICSNYDDWGDAEQRAKKIVLLLNEDRIK